jgi:hypothetical protein
VVAEPVEDVIVDTVLSRLDSPMLADYMAGRTQSDTALAALSETLAADQRQLEELAGLYAAGAVTAREWIGARDPIQHR